MIRDCAKAIRLSEEEVRVLGEAARREDVSVSHIIRRAIKREMERIDLEDKKQRGKRTGLDRKDGRGGRS